MTRRNERKDNAQLKFFSKEKGFGFVRLNSGEEAYLPADKFCEHLKITSFEVVIEEGRRGWAVKSVVCPTCLRSSEAKKDRIKSLSELAREVLAVYNRRLGEKALASWRGHSAGPRYDQFCKVWTQSWGKLAPEGWEDRKGDVCGPEDYAQRRLWETVIRSHLDLWAAMDVVRSAFAEELCGGRRTELEAEVAEASRLEQEIKDRLPPCKMVWCSAGDDEWQEREDGLGIFSAAKPGELEKITAARNRYQRFLKIWRSVSLKVTDIGVTFREEGFMEFLLVAGINIEPGATVKFRGKQLVPGIFEELGRIGGKFPRAEAPKKLLGLADQLLQEIKEDFLKEM